MAIYFNIITIVLKNIFIVDDDTQYIEVLKTLLKKNYTNMDVYTYTNGYEAMKEFSKYQPDLIILDNDMPTISGLNLYKKFKTKLEKTHLLIVTSNLRAIEEFKNFGIKNILHKPFKVNSFLSVFANIYKFYIPSK